jgi:arylsulfatase A-like enzyme
MATAVELAGAPVPANLDSISFVSTLTGKDSEQKKHDYLYWEFFERGFSQAVLMEGRWKAIRLRSRSAPIELYDLKNDIAEQNNVAAEHPDLVAKATELFKTARTDSLLWPVKDGPMTEAKKGKKT